MSWRPSKIRWQDSSLYSQGHALEASSRYGGVGSGSRQSRLNNLVNDLLEGVEKTYWEELRAPGRIAFHLEKLDLPSE